MAASIKMLERTQLGVERMARDLAAEADNASQINGVTMQ